MRIIRIDKNTEAVSVLALDEARGEFRSQFDPDKVDSLLRRIARGQTVETLASKYQNESTYCVEKRREDTQERGLWRRVRRLPR